MEKMKALFMIVNAGFAEEIVDIARAGGAGGATIINARGEGLHHQTIMGITVDSEKEMVICIVKDTLVCKIMEAVKQKAGIKSPAHGVCFSMPVEKMTETLCDTI